MFNMKKLNPAFIRLWHLTFITQILFCTLFDCLVLTLSETHHTKQHLSKVSTSFSQGHHNQRSSPYHRIDENIYHSSLQVFKDEWDAIVNKEGDFPYPSPFLFWFKCVERSVRGYLFAYPIDRLNHLKEATMNSYFNSRFVTRVNITADGVPIRWDLYPGGGDLRFQVLPGLPSSHMVKIRLEGFRHYILFPISYCHKGIVESHLETESPQSTLEANSKLNKYIIHLHMRQYTNSSKFEPKFITGIANHYLYHRCALGIDSYEVVIDSRQQGVLYMKNAILKKAADEGHLTLIIRNPSFPGPIDHRERDSNCFWQAYAENLALMRHFQEPNVKMFFMDSDEYYIIPDTAEIQTVHKYLNDHSHVRISRFMAFCHSCGSSSYEKSYVGDVSSFSLSHADYRIYDQLDDSKLVVSPDKVGCFIVHWAFCGDDFVDIPKEYLFITHFENLYGARWNLSSIRNDSKPRLEGKLINRCGSFIG